MKKPHVLNRAMFNKGGTSAYGRGITSNLVSDEQRQRFNYGGRVGFAQNSYVRPEFAIAAEEEMKGPLYTKPWLTEQFKKKYYLDTEEADTGIPITGMQGMIETEGDFDIEGRPVLSPVESRTRKLLKENPEAFEDYYQDYETTYKDKIAKQKDILAAGGKDTAMFQEDVAGPVVEEDYLKETYKKGPESEPGDLPTDRDSDVIDWETFAEGLYDKKGAKGKAQLELAGNVLAAAFQPKKEAMAILGKGLGDFGKTASARKEKMEDIAATGKMYDKIYKTRAIEKGKQDRLTQLNKIKTGNPWTDYQAALLSLKDKDDAIDFATGETVRTLTLDTKTKEVEMPSDGIPGQLFKHPTTKEYFLIDQDGKPQPINLNKYLKNLKLA